MQGDKNNDNSSRGPSEICRQSDRSKKNMSWRQMILDVYRILSIT